MRKWGKISRLQKGTELLNTVNSDLGLEIYNHSFLIVFVVFIQDLCPFFLKCMHTFPIKKLLHSAQYFVESWILPGMDTLFRNSDYKD